MKSILLIIVVLCLMSQTIRTQEQKLGMVQQSSNQLNNIRKKNDLLYDSLRKEVNKKLFMKSVKKAGQNK